jgi:hypothetical protein
VLPFRRKVLMSAAPAGMIHTARNAVVDGFLAHPFSPEYLLFIDTDITWEPHQVWSLLETATTHDLPAVSGLVCFKQTEDGPLVPMLYNDDFKLVPVSADVQRVFCAGMGFMLLRRDALETIATTYPWPTPWFDYGHRNGKAVSEDVIFSQRCLELDIPIHVDTRIAVGHRKTQTLRMVGACLSV